MNMRVDRGLNRVNKVVAAVTQRIVDLPWESGGQVVIIFIHLWIPSIHAP
jgi:hypothetical protein